MVRSLDDFYHLLLSLYFHVFIYFISAVGEGANSADEGGGPTNPAKMAKVSNKSKKNMAKRPKTKTDD